MGGRSNGGILFGLLLLCASPARAIEMKELPTPLFGTESTHGDGLGILLDGAGTVWAVAYSEEPIPTIRFKVRTARPEEMALARQSFEKLPRHREAGSGTRYLSPDDKVEGLCHSPWTFRWRVHLLRRASAEAPIECWKSQSEDDAAAAVVLNKLVLQDPDPLWLHTVDAHSPRVKESLLLLIVANGNASREIMVSSKREVTVHEGSLKRWGRLRKAGKVSEQQWDALLKAYREIAALPSGDPPLAALYCKDPATLSGQRYWSAFFEPQRSEMGCMSPAFGPPDTPIPRFITMMEALVPAKAGK